MLQKWRHFRVPLQKASAFSSSFSSASVAAKSPRGGDGLKGKIFTVSYLVDSLGLTTKLAESISRKVSSGNPDSVVNLLISNGFIDSQISSIITDYPGLLMLDAEKNLSPKLRFLQSRGASSSEITEIVSKIPKILGMKGIAISRYYDFVKVIVEADKSVEFQKLCHSLPQGSKQENKVRNVLVLRELGVPQKLLFSMLISHFQTVCGKEKFEESLKTVLEMGFDPTTSKFVHALRIIQGLSDKTTQEKVNLVCKKLGFASVEDVWEIFKKCPIFLARSEKKIADSIETFLGLGFSRDEFTTIVKRYPECIGCSAENVKKKTEFLVKKMNWALKALVLFPQVYGLSMEKRIVPRCNVIKALLSKGFLKSELPPMAPVLAITDQAFLNKYVRKHEEDKELVAELMAIFNRRSNF